MNPKRLAILPSLALLLAGCDAEGTAGTRVCGDGILQAGEDCDDPADPTCRSDCTRRRCGDGVVDPGEACDAPADPDCRPDCTRRTCGDGILDPGEECDDSRDPACRPDCTVDRCGNGTVDAPEECDDPDDPACREDCTLRRCGDGIPDPGEECDAPSDPACRSDCTAVRCGDGRIDPPGEKCDDGNEDPDDACFECRIQPAWTRPCDSAEDCENRHGLQFACVDPDDDGVGPGWCVPISQYGADCDPARVVSVCAEGTTCVPSSQNMYPTPWTCVARCGDGRLDPDEACDRAENGVCGPGCTAPVATCEEPADLSAAFNSQFLSAIWRGPGLPGPVAVARFEARYAGNYLFTYEPSDYAGALALYPGDGCGDAARELGRATGFPGEPVALARTLAEREAVFLGLEGPAGAPFRLTAKLREGMCGNGSVLDGHTEECDDGNTISGDGCSELCLVERAEGEACSASPVTAYLDGKLLPSDGDDTAPSCLADAGSVDASRRFVAPEAGRYEFRARIERGPAALTLRDEACGPVEHGCTPLHEGYTQATPGVLLRDLGDGEAVAAVVDGPAGARFSLAIERVSCDDGLTAASEECDGQDYCLADCRVGPGEREPNDTPAQAELPDAAPRRAHLASATDVDTWMVHTPEEAWGPVVRRVRLGLGTPGGCFPPGPGHDFLRLRLVGENGQLLAEVRSPGPGRCPELNFQATSGGIDYVQVVRGADAGDGPIGPYFLRW